MTISPSLRVRGVEGKPTERAPTCSVPGCLSRSSDGHHIWPRSKLRGEPYEWVELPDGRVVANVTGLCQKHHVDVTGPVGGHWARIDVKDGLLWWYARVVPWLQDGPDEMRAVGPLWPQPPGWTDKDAEPPPHPLEDAEHGLLREGQTCPKCGYRKPRTTAKQPKRKAKTWSLQVPDDAELGTEVLDAWVEDFAALLGLDTSSPRLLRYHVLVTVLAWAAQNQALFLIDVVEAAKA